MLLLHRHQSALPFLLDLHRGQPFLLVNDLIFHLILLLDLEQLVAFLLIVLTSDDLGLLGLLSLRQLDGLLHLSLLFLALFVEGIVVLRLHPGVLVLHLVVIDLLLDPVLVSLLESQDLACSFFGVIDLLPCFHFFLFEESDTVGQ